MCSRLYACVARERTRNICSAKRLSISPLSCTHSYTSEEQQPRGRHPWSLGGAKQLLSRRACCRLSGGSAPAAQDATDASAKMGKLKRAPAPDGPPERSPVAKAAAVSALRETLRLSEAANASERRESARRLSQQAHRFATTEDGLGIERVQIEADVRVRRVLNALRDKDDQLAAATLRIEDLETQLRLSQEECAKLKKRNSGLEDLLQEKKEELGLSEARSTQRKLEGARTKGLLADSRFDLDLLGSKYERLLDERATVGLSRELVQMARKDMNNEAPDDGSQVTAASFDVVSRLSTGVKASKAAALDAENEVQLDLGGGDISDAD